MHPKRKLWKSCTEACQKQQQKNGSYLQWSLLIGFFFKKIMCSVKTMFNRNILEQLFTERKANLVHKLLRLSVKTAPKRTHMTWKVKTWPLGLSCLESERFVLFNTRETVFSSLAIMLTRETLKLFHFLHYPPFWWKPIGANQRSFYIWIHIPGGIPMKIHSVVPSTMKFSKSTPINDAAFFIYANSWRAIKAKKV